MFGLAASDEAAARGRCGRLKFMKGVRLLSYPQSDFSLDKRCVPGRTCSKHQLQSFRVFSASIRFCDLFQESDQTWQENAIPNLVELLNAGGLNRILRPNNNTLQCLPGIPSSSPILLLHSCGIGLRVLYGVFIVAVSWSRMHCFNEARRLLAGLRNDC